jgi:hypothetical protein
MIESIENAIDEAKDLSRAIDEVREKITETTNYREKQRLWHVEQDLLKMLQRVQRKFNNGE